MFDLGWSKVLILAVVAIVVVGPKELPALLRAVGQFIAQLRRHAAEFRAQFDEAMKSPELDQIRKDVEAIKTDAQASLRGIERSIEEDAGEVKTSVEKAVETVEAHGLAGQGSHEPYNPGSNADGAHAAANGSEPHPAPEPELAVLPEPAGYATPVMPVPVAAEPALAPTPAKTGTPA